jgi:hypothetical protein
MAGKERYSAQTVAAALTRSRGMISYAARMLNCSHMTIRRSIERHAVVREAREAAIESIIDLAELRVIEAAAAGNLSACYFILKTLGARRGWSEAVTVRANVTTRHVTPRSLRTDYAAYNAWYVEHVLPRLDADRAVALALMNGDDADADDGDAEDDGDQEGDDGSR